jgi:hypothetical protein
VVAVQGRRARNGRALSDYRYVLLTASERLADRERRPGGGGCSRGGCELLLLRGRVCGGRLPCLALAQPALDDLPAFHWESGAELAPELRLPRGALRLEVHGMVLKRLYVVLNAVYRILVPQSRLPCRLSLAREPCERLAGLRGLRLRTGRAHRPDRG